MSTQLLFGETFQILECSDDLKWLKIKINHDQYTGWIDALQASPVSEQYYRKYEHTKHALSTDIIGTVHWPKHKITIPMGCTLPFLHNEKINIDGKVYPFTGKSSKTSEENFEGLVPTALSYRGTPYLWGGKTHFGIDCSGFLQQLFKINGFNLPRDAHQQEKYLTQAVSMNDLRAGDIAFFHRDQKVIHVGMMLDNNTIIHARGSVRLDDLDEKGIWNQEENKYSHQLFSIKRISNQ